MAFGYRRYMNWTAVILLMVIIYVTSFLVSGDDMNKAVQDIIF
ncbi:hypothetical protein DSUL_160050 [Desulfovibrionales bacterium]